MKILLVGYNAPDKYSGVFLRNVQKAMDVAGLNHDTRSPDELGDVSKFDIVIGTGDELFRKSPDLVSYIKSNGVITADFRTKFMPKKPKALVKYLFQNELEKCDYVFTHQEQKLPRAIFVGQGFDETLLYPEQEEIFTVLIDHWFPKRRVSLRSILASAKELYGNRSKVRVWYHNHTGIAENIFDESTQQYQTLPFTELASYYRRTHVFLPTHRETQGIVGAETGMCGAHTFLEKWMYPAKVIQHIPHTFYKNGSIPWPDTVDIKANREFTMKHYGIEVFAKRIEAALQTVMAKHRLG